MTTMNDFTPHYDVNGAFRYVTLHATDYGVGHPIAALWCDWERLRRGLDKLASGQIFNSTAYAINLFDGMAVNDAVQADLNREFGL